MATGKVAEGKAECVSIAFYKNLGKTKGLNYSEGGDQEPRE